MKGYRFYAEMPQDRKSKSASKANPFFPWTVKALRERAAQGFRADLVAVFIDPNRPGQPIYTNGGFLECATVAIEGNRLSYAVDGAAGGYLRQRTTRIPEDLARVLSPELFRYLES